MVFSQSARTRFWKKVDKSGDCWIWTAAKNNKGYGKFSIATSKHRGAHIVSWEIENGPIPSGQWVLHHCDNRRCVNPAHLFLGNVIDNNADMRAKNRHAHGERQGSSKLKAANVSEILSLRKQGVTLSVLARQFGVCEATISLIVNGKRWRHA